MTKFKVLFENKIRKELEFEADSYEDAMKLALKEKVEASTTLHPTWIGESEHTDGTGEFEHEYLGDCDWCHKPIVNRTVEGQPWTYASDPRRDCEGLICYPCVIANNLLEPDGSIKKIHETNH